MRSPQVTFLFIVLGVPSSGISSLVGLGWSGVNLARSRPSSLAGGCNARVAGWLWEDVYDLSFLWLYAG